MTKCKKCGGCCEQTGASIFLNTEIELLSRFKRLHSRQDCCPFNSPINRECSVYPHRPTICRAWNCITPGPEGQGGCDLKTVTELVKAEEQGKAKRMKFQELGHF